MQTCRGLPEAGRPAQPKPIQAKVCQQLQAPAPPESSLKTCSGLPAETRQHRSLPAANGPVEVCKQQAYQHWIASKNNLSRVREEEEEEEDKKTNTSLHWEAKQYKACTPQFCTLPKLQ